MKLKAPTICPACLGEYETTRLTCKKCGSELTGKFSGCSFCHLSTEEADFVLAFLKCGGSIKEMERYLSISYPTVKNKLNQITQKLGLSVTNTQEEIKNERLKIIEDLNQGKIDAKKAAQLIKDL